MAKKQDPTKIPTVKRPQKRFENASKLGDRLFDEAEAQMNENDRKRGYSLRALLSVLRHNRK